MMRLHICFYSSAVLVLFTGSSSDLTFDLVYLQPTVCVLQVTSEQRNNSFLQCPINDTGLVLITDIKTLVHITCKLTRTKPNPHHDKGQYVTVLSLETQ